MGNASFSASWKHCLALFGGTPMVHKIGDPPELNRFGSKHPWIEADQLHMAITIIITFDKDESAIPGMKYSFSNWGIHLAVYQYLHVWWPPFRTHTELLTSPEFLTHLKARLCRPTPCESIQWACCGLAAGPTDFPQSTSRWKKT